MWPEQLNALICVGEQRVDSRLSCKCRSRNKQCTSRRTPKRRPTLVEIDNCSAHFLYLIGGLIDALIVRTGSFGGPKIGTISENLKPPSVDAASNIGKLCSTLGSHFQAECQSRRAATATCENVANKQQRLHRRAVTCFSGCSLFNLKVLIFRSDHRRLLLIVCQLQNRTTTGVSVTLCVCVCVTLIAQFWPAGSDKSTSCRQ